MNTMKLRTYKDSLNPKLLVLFIAFWIGIYWFVVQFYCNFTPEVRKIEWEKEYFGHFIGERAEQNLLKIGNLGERVVGSNANEVEAVKLILDEVNGIAKVMNREVFQLAVDVQEVEGAFESEKVIFDYRSVQNIVVKLSSTGCLNHTFLLVNTHFDSMVGGQGYGDDGPMVATALEVLRVLATETRPLQHQIVFLFNGAGAQGLQGSHGFITKHKWAKRCKFFINLESVGSTKRDVLFSVGPFSEWMLKFYKKSVIYPHCTSVGEDILSRFTLPQSEFHIFHHRCWYGMNIQHTHGGKFYRTEYDSSAAAGAMQVTGDNTLALIKVFANATVPVEPNLQKREQTVFYDFLGYFVVMYSKQTAAWINYSVSLVAIIVAIISTVIIAESSKIDLETVYFEFFVMIGLDLIGIALGFFIPRCVAVEMQNANFALTWYSQKWLIFGLYVCPAIFGFAGPTTLRICFLRSSGLSLAYKIQVVLNAHLVLMAALTMWVTHLGITSAYVPMMSVFFFTASLIFNLYTGLFRKDFKWIAAIVVGQFLPFMYHAYLSHLVYWTVIPMLVHYEATKDEELGVALVSAAIGVVSLGFVVPLLSLFRRPRTVLLVFFAVFLAFLCLAVTSLGFPYRREKNVEVATYQHVQRKILYSVYSQRKLYDSGFFIRFHHRTKHSIMNHVNFSDSFEVSTQCRAEILFCGMPVANWAAVKYLNTSTWVPDMWEQSDVWAYAPSLVLVAREVNLENLTVRFEFELQGPAHVGIFIRPLTNVTVTRWSFFNALSDKEQTPSYFIQVVQGKFQFPLKFFVVVKELNDFIDEPLMQLAVAGQFLSVEHRRSNFENTFKKSFPDFAHVVEWPSSLEVWFF